MSGWKVAVVLLLYAWQAVECWRQGDASGRWWALIWGAYALANAGFIALMLLERKPPQ